MEKIALITDSASDVDREAIKKYDVRVLPFRITYKDRECLDNIDISSDEVYENLKKEMPESSSPSMHDMEELFQKLENEHYTHAIAVVLSSGLSGISNAIKVVSDNHKKLITHICDSKSISIGEGLIVEDCGKLISKGKTFKEIVGRIPDIMNSMNLFFIVGTLEYLIKGGRIGLVSGALGELLNIKPIISVNENGKYYTYLKVRGRQQSLRKMIDIGNDFLKQKKYDIYVVHGHAEEAAHKVYEMLSQLPNLGFIRFGGQISPVAGMHSGPGLVGVCFKECLLDD